MVRGALLGGELHMDRPKLCANSLAEGLGQHQPETEGTCEPSDRPESIVAVVEKGYGEEETGQYPVPRGSCEVEYGWRGHIPDRTTVSQSCGPALRISCCWGRGKGKFVWAVLRQAPFARSSLVGVLPQKTPQSLRPR